MRHLRPLAVALVLAVMPMTLSVLVAVASPTKEVTKEAHRHAFSATMCQQLTHKTGCYVVETVTHQESVVAPLVTAFVKPVSAWYGCWGPWTLSQTVYSSIGTPMATGRLRVQACWDNRGIAIPYMQCWVSATILYGGAVNFCASPAWPSIPQGNPTWAEEGWYFYPYPMPWWHINNVQQWGIYTTGVSPWYMCSYC